jgi:hypothetical protein
LGKYIGEFAYFDMARKVAASGDSDKVEAITGFAREVMSLATEHRRADLFRQAGRIVEAVYWSAAVRPDLAGPVAESIDAMIDSVTMHLDGYRRSSATKATPASLPLVQAALAWILELIRVAVATGRPQDACDFLDRIETAQEHQYSVGGASEFRDVVLLKDYARLLSFAQVM